MVEKSPYSIEADPHALLDAMATLVGVLDLKGRLRFLNRSAVSFLGVSGDELYGTAFWACPWFKFGSRSQGIVRASVLESVRGKSFRCRVTAYRKDDQIPFDALFSSSPVNDRNGDTVAVVVEMVVASELISKGDALTYERKAFRIIADAAVNSYDVRDLCRRVLVSLARTIGFDRGNVRIYDEMSDTLVPFAVFDDSDEDQVSWVRPHDLNDVRFISSVTAKRRIPLFAPDVTAHEIYREYKESLDRWKIRAFISWPLIGSKNRLLGVMQLLNKEAKSGFSYEDQTFFETVASMFATVLERKIIEEEIARGLEEKNLLLKEVHHRVKNNLQIISSLLNLQLRSMEGKDFKELVRESQNRVRSMALVHEVLYRSDDLSGIDFDKYLKELASYLQSVYGISVDRVKIAVNAKGMHLNIDQAITCGLLVNELVTNALKYAFPGDRRGLVTVDFHRESGASCLLSVKDDGIGLPSDFDSMKDKKTLGMNLVSMLCEQLGGTFQVDQSNGLAFIFRFDMTVNT